VVSTDCPSGPRELLDGGRIAPLVPMGDTEALAEAMLGALRDPGSASLRNAAVSAYHHDASARAYLHTLGLGGV